VWLVDTSCWIELLRRKGKPAVQSRVQSLLRKGEAAWCEVIRLELWNGTGGDQDLKVLKELELDVPSLELNAEVWETSTRLAQRLRADGVTVPVTDIVIQACARVHQVEIDSLDGHFRLMEKYR
jgi:predicted nucleic acid-binding protein